VHTLGHATRGRNVQLLAAAGVRSARLLFLAGLPRPPHFATDVMAGTPDVRPGTFARRYIIERELGRGATATVYLARDLGGGRSVAIKILKPELAETVGAARFLREIKVNQQLHHPHVVTVLDSGEHEGQLYFVLPLMEGGSLRQRLDRERQLPLASALGITRTIASALDYAHKQGLIHRDVKPENILFTGDQACLADFGIARAIERAIDESTTATGLVRGTPAYMSPEQASGSKQYDGRSDVYSLACVFYEMVAGVPAFIGPTPEAVIAQRFQHAPRELRVYRASVPAALETVLSRALQIAPADRFESAGAFAEALDAAANAPLAEPRTSGPSALLTPQRKWALAGAAVFVIAVVALASVGGRALWGSRAAGLDSTRYALLPVDPDPSQPTAEAYVQLHEGFTRWSGIDVVNRFDVRDAVPDSQAVLSDREAVSVARRLRAGRYVRSRITKSGRGVTMNAVLFDARTQTPIRESSGWIPVPIVGAELAVDSIVSQLLLGRRDGARLGTRALPAAQRFAMGMESVGEFNLARADSLLSAALDTDRQFSRAALWLAQTRAWLGLPSDRWVTAAELALADSGRFDRSEIAMARALAAMAARQFAIACARYREMIRQDTRSFAGWYGLGECLRRDNIVVPDPRSPSGWRFRNSYHVEAGAYQRAFELLPAVYRGFQAGGFSRLRQLLFTSSRDVRVGVSNDSAQRRFLARVRLTGDSLALVPFEMALVVAGDRRAAADARAVERARRVFYEIAARWAAAYPRSAAAKEGIAIALELQGERAALDSLRAAARVASDPEQRLRFVSAATILQLKHSAPGDTAELESVRSVADSILRALPAPSVQEATLMAPLAALLGRCSDAAALIRRAATSETFAGITIPRDLNADAEALDVRTALGCAAEAADAAPAGIIRRLEAATPGASAEERRVVESTLIGSAVSRTFPLDTALIRRLAPVGGYLLSAELSAIRGNKDEAVRTLRRIADSRGNAIAGDLTPDALLPEALLWLHLGDSVAATATIDATLLPIRYHAPLNWAEPANNAARLGSLVRMMALRARLAYSRDRVAAKHWAAAVLTLWKNADASQETELQAMRRIAAH
jgi:eukaryotic-like serine/threonine-protein kinase